MRIVKLVALRFFSVFKALLGLELIANSLSFVSVSASLAVYLL